MGDEANILSLVRAAAGKRILFLPHAIRQMSRPDRMITTSEIRSVIFDGQIIEDYLPDKDEWSDDLKVRL